MSNIALVIVDVQQGLEDGEPYFGGRRNNPAISTNIPTLLSLFRTAHKPIFHIKHNSINSASPIHPSEPGNAIFPWAAPIDGEPVYTKTVSSAFIGTPLEQTLRGRGITRLVMCGIASDQCVSTSVRMAQNLGFEVFLVGDASATFDRVGPDGVKRLAEDMHMYSLTSLDGEFCQVVNTEDVQNLIK
ncbi:isochorismatase hydrolase [Phlebopus sp. FC_14]|nr:isochorismatase hydrolase [Phlebopus sp. FC_14]